MQQKNKLKVIISGGGTGGHIYPAIAIANAVKDAAPDSEILFVGAKDRMEMQKVPAAGYTIEGLWISGLQRKLTVDNLLFPVKLLVSFLKAKSIIKKFKPDIAIGVGGYASWPLLEAANFTGIPTLIQEQNSYAGITNKRLSKKVDKICVAYPGMEKFFPKDKLVFTGNPVRKDIMEVDSKKKEALDFFGLQEGKKTILVIGGSLGARTINESVGGMLDKFQNENVQLVWQTGKTYFEEAKKVAAASGYAGVKVFDFIYKMDLAYAVADVVISRAGALSISELCLATKPVILVPSPNVAEDHQTKNAMALVSENAAQMIKDNEAKETLVPAALKLLADEDRKNNYKSNINRLGKPEAAKEIVDVIFEILKKKKS